MKKLLKAILLTFLIISLGYSEPAPNFFLKDRNNTPINLYDMKNKAVVLVFSNTENKTLIDIAKKLKKIYKEDDLKVIFITTNLDLSPIDFNSFVIRNNLKKSGILTLQGDEWTLNAYSVKNKKTAVIVLKKMDNKYFIMKKFYGKDAENFDKLKVVIENIIYSK